MEKITFNTPGLMNSNFIKNEEPPKSGTPSFGEMLNNSLNEINKLQVQAGDAISKLASGENTDIHKTMIAMEKASVSFNLLLEIRNKVITAYETLSRTSV